MAGPYYIDPTVAGPGTGSYADPFKSWASVTWSAGTTYLQKRGTVFDGTTGRITIGAAGSSGLPITLGAYGGASDPRPVLDGGGTRDIAIIATNYAYLDVEDFEIRNYINTSANFGTTGDDGSVVRNINLRRIWVHDIGANVAGSGGVKFWGSGVTLEDVLIERIGDDGVFCDGPNATFRRVTIRDVSISGGGRGDGVQFGGNYCTGLLIEDCNWDHSYNSDKQILVLHGALEAAATFQIRRSVFSGYSSGAGCITLDVLTDATGGCVFERNTLRGNRGFRWSSVDTLGRGVIARSNLLIGIGDAPSNYLQAFSSVNGKALSNTFVGWSRGAQVGGGEVRNNVFKDITDFDYDASTAGNITKNCYWNVGRHGPTAAGASDINADPLLTSGYHPLPGSPLLGAGTPISGLTRDLDGKWRRNPPAIGAFDLATLRTGT